MQGVLPASGRPTRSSMPSATARRRTPRPRASLGARRSRLRRSTRQPHEKKRPCARSGHLSIALAQKAGSGVGAPSSSARPSRKTRAKWPVAWASSFGRSREGTTRAALRHSTVGSSSPRRTRSRSRFWVRARQIRGLRASRRAPSLSVVVRCVLTAGPNAPTRPHRRWVARPTRHAGSLIGSRPALDPPVTPESESMRTLR